MLQRSYRLPARTKLTTPLFFKHQFFSLRVAKNGSEHSRFGFVISKKIAKTAVDRNTSKRKLRGCIEKQFAAIKPGHDFLFILSKNLSEVETQIICQEVEILLQTNKFIS